MKRTEPQIVDCLPLSRRCATGGFTLIEVILALLLFATGIVTLLGITTAATNRTVRDYWAQQSTLLARKILSEYEAGIKPLDIGAQDLDVDKLLEDGFTEEVPENVFARVEVRYVELPLLDPESIKEIRATVSWGEDVSEQITLSYFVLADDDEEEPVAGAAPTPAPPN